MPYKKEKDVIRKGTATKFTIYPSSVQSNLRSQLTETQSTSSFGSKHPASAMGSNVTEPSSISTSNYNETLESLEALEKDIFNAHDLSKDQPDNGKLAKEAIAKKNVFERSLYTLCKRTGNKIFSNIWQKEYGKIIVLSKRGDMMVKKGGKNDYVVYLIPTNTISQHVLLADSKFFKSLARFGECKNPIICMFCWNDPTKDVRSCIHETKNYNVTNITTHLLGQHSNENLILEKTAKQTEDVNQTLLNCMPMEKKDTSVKTSTSATVVAEKSNSMLYRFFLSANIAITQANNPHLNNWMKYMIEKGYLLKGKTVDVTFSRYKYKKQEIFYFNTFIGFVKLMIEKTRNHYIQEFGTTVPFISVSHDGWDSKDNDVLGVSIHFIVPEDWVRVSLAVGLRRVLSKTSSNTVMEINKMLHRYGICSGDIFRGINDTTNSALLTGIQIAEGRAPTTKGTTCFMHSQELVICHALGLRERRKKKEVFDSFVLSKNIRDQVKLLLSKIMDKKSKGRFPEYNAMCMQFLQCEANVLEIPNETRVSGTYKMYLSALRSRRIIVLFLNNCKDPKKFEDYVLTNHEWQFVAECEAVLREADVLAMKSQEDDVSSNVFAYFMVAKTRAAIRRIKSLKVFNLNESWTPKTPVEDIPKIAITKNDLMEETQFLITRLIIEYDRYFPHPDSDQLLMMMFHPIMVNSGFQFLQYVDEDNFSIDQLKSMKVLVIDFLCDLYNTPTVVTEQDTDLQDALVTEVGIPEIIIDGQETHEMEEDEDYDPFADVYKKIFAGGTETKQTTTDTNSESIKKEKTKELRNRVTTQLELYIKHCEQLEIVSLLDQFGKEEYKKNKKTIKTKKLQDPLYVSKLFDVMKWWKDYGALYFREMSCGACIMLGKPTHNGFQERVFSRGTYADCKLKKKLKPNNFEMKVLNSLNISVVEDLMKQVTLKLKCDHEDANIIQNLKSFFDTSCNKEILQQNDLPIKVHVDEDDDVVSVDVTVKNLEEDSEDVEIEDLQDEDEEHDNGIIQIDFAGMSSNNN